MYFWNSFPFIRYSIALILGIWLTDQLPISLSFSFQLLYSSFALFVLNKIVSSKIGFSKTRTLSGILGFIFLISTGTTLTNIKYHHHGNQHYSQLTKRINAYSGIIKSPINEREDYHRYELEIIQVLMGDSIINSNGKILFYVRKDSFNNQYNYGDKLLIKGNFFSIDEPSNLYEFNYKKYLARQNIYAQSFVDSHEIKIVENQSNNLLLSTSYFLRKKLGRSIDQLILEKRENAIAKALILGIKDYLDNDIKQHYASAGAMHVLAVSGLHVGIIFLILQVTIGFFKKKGKKGKFIFASISILNIWFYALITGLSASVLRAATMFSLMALAEGINRESNIYNTLGLAAFILLIAEPYLIYSVGFQLSFAAVFGIVYLQPRLMKGWESSNYLLHKIWSISCVSIAAQIATFPISAYYFHQFPTYFLVSNLIVIPSAFIILSGGIIMLGTFLFSTSLGVFIGRIIEWFIWILNEFIQFIYSLPFSVINWIYLDQAMVFGIYLCFILVFIAFYRKSIKPIFICGLIVISLCFHLIIRHHQLNSQEELIFYDIKNQIIVDYIKGFDVKTWVHTDSSTLDSFTAFQINPNRLRKRLTPFQSQNNLIFYTTPLKSVQPVTFGNKRIILFDSTTFHINFKKKIDCDYVIINNQSVKNLKWLQDKINYKHLMLGFGNGWWYEMNLKKQALELNNRVHSLKKDGYLMIRP